MGVDPTSLAYVSAALCGGGVLVIGLVNLADPGYGREALRVLASVYPGYTANRTIESVFIGTGYALVKGAALGWLAGWLYNRLQQSKRQG
ncbi:MAG: hypothetical protein Q8R91_07840 [Candidatus Omnitrophota bacterium]|nr:hypothetical protein [Candidatus Omnitrophota bacterium]